MAFPLIAAALALAEFSPIIARWIGSDPKDTQDVAVKVTDIAQKITQSTNPLDAIQKLHESTKLVQEFQKAIVQMEADLELSYLNDRQQARERDLALVAMGRQNRRADIMVFCAAAGLAMCLGALGYFGERLPGEAVGILSTVTGIFGACLKDVYAFEFGSSRGSKDKDSTVAALVGKN